MMFADDSLRACLKTQESRSDPKIWLYFFDHLAQ
jgi:hypothetical protein